MDVPVMRWEKFRDLRKDRDLNLEQLAEQTGMAASTLGKYETQECKDYSAFCVAVLAKFYGVTTDYLLGLTEQENHPNAELLDLHLSDEMIELLRSGEINNALLCEIATHKNFRNLLMDIEIYVDRIASMQIDNMNAILATIRAQILSQHQTTDRDLYLRTLDAAFIQEDKYFTHTVHAGLDAILSDIRDAHKSDVTTADDMTIAKKLKQDIEAAANFKDSSLEQQMRIYCNQLGIPYDKLTPEELNGVMSALKKSEYLNNGQSKRGKSRTTQGKGSRKS